MDLFRYVLALVLVCTLLPLLVYWPLIHGFIGFWRRLGPSLTYVMVWGVMTLSAFGLYRVRGHLLRVDFGTNWLLVALGTLSSTRRSLRDRWSSSSSPSE